MSKVRATSVKPIVQQHQKIIDAIAGREPEKARSAMRNHLSAATEGLLAATEVDAMERAREEVEKHRKRYGNRGGAGMTA